MIENATTPEAAQEETASFGFREVALDAKQGMVNSVFHTVADRYDLMNDLMSAGLHRAWKSAMVARLNPPKSGLGPYHVLDVAGGTGDIAFRIVEASKRTAQATVFDINGSMLAVGAERARDKGLSGHVAFQEGNAEQLPFDSGTFDAYTIAFGIRNVPRIDKALSEAFRVLKPGGKFLCLEFSAVDVPMMDKIYDAYSFNVIPRLGQLVTNDADSYQYLVESIRRFPKPKRFAAMIEAAGFERVSHTPMTGGIAALHSGVKL